MKISGRKGKGYLSHNNRTFTPLNVDAERIKNNIYYRREPLEQAYDKCFKKAFEEYNSKVRKDRRFSGSYLEKLCQSKSKHPPKPYYEWVAQVGDKNCSGYGTENAQEAERILHEYINGFRQRNPQLYVFNAVMHRDEATPHIHIDFIPIAYFVKGQRYRNSLDRAFEQMGYGKSKSRRDSNTMRWQKQEREVLRCIAREHGLQIDDEQPNKNVHLENDMFRKMARELEQQRKQIESLQNLKQNSILSLAERIKETPALVGDINRAIKITLGEETPIPPVERFNERSR